MCGVETQTRKSIALLAGHGYWCFQQGRSVGWKNQCRSHSVFQQFCHDPLPAQIQRGRKSADESHLLPRHPAPKLEGGFTDTPYPGKIAEFTDMRVVERKRQRMFVVVQIELAYLTDD